MATKKTLTRDHQKMGGGTRVKRSTIPEAGQGLFAARDFAKGETLCFYTGEILDREGLKSRYGKERPRFVMQLSSHMYVDALKSTGPARFINGMPRMNDPLVNCRFVDSRSRPIDERISVRALRDIRRGEEIFVCYGRGHILPPFTYPACS